MICICICICICYYNHNTNPNTNLVVYTPQRKSGRRLNDEEIIYDDERVSQILLNDPNSAFISNPVNKKG
jgi:hypothetical protein